MSRPIPLSALRPSTPEMAGLTYVDLSDALRTTTTSLEFCTSARKRASRAARSFINRAASREEMRWRAIASIVITSAPDAELHLDTLPILAYREEEHPEREHDRERRNLRHPSHRDATRGIALVLPPQLR